MKDKFQILRDFANSNNKPDKTIYQFIKEVLDMNSTYAKENKQLKDNWNMLKEHLKNRYNNGTESISYRQVFLEIREMMQELDQGSDDNNGTN